MKLRHIWLFDDLAFYDPTQVLFYLGNLAFWKQELKLLKEIPQKANQVLWDRKVFSKLKSLKNNKH